MQYTKDARRVALKGDAHKKAFPHVQGFKFYRNTKTGKKDLAYQVEGDPAFLSNLYHLPWLREGDFIVLRPGRVPTSCSELDFGESHEAL